MVQRLLKAAKMLFAAGSVAFAVAILGVTVVGFLPNHGYIADQCSQLRLVYLVALLPLAIAFVLLRSRWLALVSLLSLLANGAACMPLFVPSERSASSDAPRLKIVATNIWGAKNQQYDTFAHFVREENPDVLCIEEITPVWMRAIRCRLPDYSYSFDEGVSGGAAIFSKIPIQQIIPQPENGRKVRRFGVRGEVSLQGQRLLIIAEHPPAPSDRKRWRLRNREFARLTRDIQNTEIPTVIAGDFNSTPWSSYFQSLVNSTKLCDSELGEGVQPTWSTRMPLMLVPIDHCLYSQQLSKVKRVIGPNIGSDHLPLIVELALQTPTHNLQASLSK